MPYDTCCTPGLSLCQWGRAGWTMLHVWAHNAPELLSAEQQEDMRVLTEQFTKHIPCQECKEHFRSYLRQHVTEETFQSRSGLVQLFHGAHNAVNARAGKPEMTMEKHMAMFSSPLGHSENTAPKDQTYHTAAMLVLVAVSALLLRHALNVRTKGVQLSKLDHTTR